MKKINKGKSKTCFKNLWGPKLRFCNCIFVQSITVSLEVNEVLFWVFFISNNIFKVSLIMGHDLTIRVDRVTQKYEPGLNLAIAALSFKFLVKLSFQRYFG